MSMENVNFCEGCPAANGVNVAGQVLTTFSYDADHEGFKVIFTDKSVAGRRTKPFRVGPTGDVDSSMPTATADVILEDVAKCEAVCTPTVKRLGGLLGSRTVKRCGAFPDQNPKKIKVSVRESGWFDPKDFL